MGRTHESDLQRLNDGKTLRIQHLEKGLSLPIALRVAGLGQPTFARIQKRLNPPLTYNERDRIPVEEVVRLYHFAEKLRQDGNNPLGKRRSRTEFNLPMEIFIHQL